MTENSTLPGTARTLRTTEVLRGEYLNALDNRLFKYLPDAILSRRRQRAIRWRLRSSA